MKLAKDIVSLLYTNDCVILPGLGAFIANSKPAEINKSAKYALINSRAILFNNQITENDGIVANYLAKKHGISYSEGLKQIQSFIERIENDLKERKNSEISNLGTFYRTKEDKLIFIPYHSVNFEMKSYGLPKLRLQELEHSPVSTPPVIEYIPEASVETKSAPIVVEPKKESPRVSIEIVEEKREEKLDERLATLQARREQRMLMRQRSKKRLGVVNVLGSIFLLAIAIGILNFELSAPANHEIQTASVVDTPTAQSNVIPIVEEKSATIETVVEPVKRLRTFAICIAKVNSETEAVEIANDLNPKFAQSRIESNEDGSTGVFIISFTNQSLAEEYKDFLEKKLGHKLIIKTK